MSIKVLLPQNIDQFYPIFSSVLTSEFPGYTSKVVSYLLNRLYTKETLKYWVQRKEKIIFGAYEKDSIIGFAVIDSTYGGVSFCRWLGVLKKYQHKGYGSALIHAWKGYAVRHKAHKIEVAGQSEAKTFYEKMGFDLEGFRKKSYFGIEQLLFGKIIGEPNSENMTR